MRIVRRFTKFHGVAIVGLLILSACGGSGSNSGASNTASTGQAGSVSVALIGTPTDVLSGDTPSITAQVNGTTNTSVSWTVDGVLNGNSAVGSITGSGNTITYTAPDTEGTYTLAATSVTDSTKTAIAPIHVRHNANLLAPTISAPSVASVGATGLSASVTNAQSKATYAWTISGGTIQSSTTGTSVTFSAGQAGTLTLTCNATLDTQNTSSNAQVQVQATLPTAPLITAPTSVSVGATNLTASVAQPQAGTSYSWTIVDGTITAGANSTSTTFTAGSAGTLTLTCAASNSVGTSTGQAQVQVVASAPATPVITAASQVYAQSTNNVASIPAQSNCTYAWTISGGTITSGQGTTNLTFTAGGAGTLVLGCTVTNSSSVSASAQQSIAVLTAPAQTTTGFYGSNLNGDDIGNIVVGWNTANDVCNRVTSYRFRATHTGTLQSIRPFFIWSAARAGYALGNGGDIQIQIQTDDGTSNHYPSGTTLTSLVDHAPVPVPMDSGSNYYPLLTFPTPANLTAGQLYHIVFTNITADPTANWVSLDCIWMSAKYSQEQPTLPNTDMAILEKNTAGAWVKFSRGTYTGYTPCYELDYTDGASQGQGYTGAFAYATSSFVNPKPISGAQGIRETFTVSGSNRVVTSASVRVRYLSGSSPLTIRVEKADGTLVGQGSVSNVPVMTTGDVGQSWVKVVFATPLTLAAGQSYNLVLSAPSDSSYTTHALYKSMNAYKSTTYFGDGHAQFNDGTGWKNWDEWGIQNRLDCDIQFYFETN